MPTTGVLPSVNGESWLAVEVISSSPFDNTNHAQPEPKRPVAAAVNFSWKASNEPNLASIASANSPTGFPHRLVKLKSRRMSDWHVRHHCYVQQL